MSERVGTVDIESDARPIAVRIAMHCGEPMVFTFAFPKMEHYCLDCGAKATMFGAFTVEGTADLNARKGARTEEFRRLSEGLITPFANYSWCAACQYDGTDHQVHATEAQWADDEAARARLAKRAGFPTPPHPGSDREGDME